MLGWTVFNKMRDGDALFFFQNRIATATATKPRCKTRKQSASFLLTRAAAKLIQLMEDNVNGLTR